MQAISRDKAGARRIARSGAALIHPHTYAARGVLAPYRTNATFQMFPRHYSYCGLNSVGYY